MSLGQDGRTRTCNILVPNQVGFQLPHTLHNPHTRPVSLWPNPSRSRGANGDYVGGRTISLTNKAITADHMVIATQSIKSICNPDQVSPLDRDCCILAGSRNEPAASSAILNWKRREGVDSNHQCTAEPEAGLPICLPSQTRTPVSFARPIAK